MPDRFPRFSGRRRPEEIPMTVSAGVPQAFASQIDACRALGSPFTARLLEILAAEIARPGILAGLIGDWPGDPVADALPLRLAGALHALVLSGRAPALVACYPGHADGTAAAELRPALRRAIADHPAHIAGYLRRPPQTNETLRSAVLVGGFTTLARATDRPLRLLEIGASAGLNNIWDKYRYRLGAASLGPADSPVVLRPDWQGLPPPAEMPAILSRAACDQSPTDLAKPEQRLRLRSYIWADQQDRLARLDAAMTMALEHGVRVEQADAGDWLAGQLAEPDRDAVPVVYHSIMWQYLPDPLRQRLRRSMTEASHGRMLAWLRFEPAGLSGPFELRLTLWRNGRADETLLATAHAHGAWIRWLG
jgi:hypothetical protein